MKKFKKLLAGILTLAMLVTMAPATAMANDVPELPTATVTPLEAEVEGDKLTFALNFKADEATDEQKAYYANWPVDFELTVNKEVTFNAFDDEADGYLAGQYDEWSENWVTVPFSDVTVEAGKTFKIMEYAADLMGEPGLKYTYGEVFGIVKDFDCGVLFTDEFLAANPDLVVTLELKMYNPADGEDYLIGDSYIFELEAPELPTATVTPLEAEVEGDKLTFALNFKADEATDEQKAYYANWLVDFELTVNKEVTFNAFDDEADGYLAGQYDEWSENWVTVPFSDVTVEAGKTFKIMEYAADLMSEPGLKYTYGEVFGIVKDFDCGVLFTDEFLAANPDLVVTLELRMYNPADESESYVIGETYIFTVAPKTVTVTFDTNEGSKIKPVEVKVGDKLDKPSDPTRSGYRFMGWFTNESCTKEYNFNKVVTEDMTLYACWSKNSSGSTGGTSGGSTGGSGSGSSTIKHDVDVVAKGDAAVSVNKDKASKGEKVVITVTPEEGKKVENVIVTDEKGNVLDVTKVDENKFSFVMPNGEVDINVTTETVYEKEIVLQVGNTVYSDNDVKKQSDVAPVIVGDRTLVPIRIIIEALGGNVAWNEVTRTVTMVIDGKVLTLTIDQLIPEFGTGATIINGRTMVPIRYVSEYVGAEVVWDAATQQVIIKK